MGWYVTCSICGEEGKYGLNCNCYAKQTVEIAKSLINCKIIDSFVIDDFPLMLLIQKLTDPDGKIFYLQTCLQDGGGEYSYFQKIKGLKEEDYDNYKKCKDCEEPKVDEQIIGESLVEFVRC